MVSAGKGAEHSLIGCLNFSWYDPKRKAARLKQAGRGGIGHGLPRQEAQGARRPRAGIKADLNNAADRARIQKVGSVINKEIHDLDDEQCNMRGRARRTSSR